jgi:hypothetical protein
MTTYHLPIFDSLWSREDKNDVNVSGPYGDVNAPEWTAAKIPYMYSIFWELRGLSLNFHIHASVIDLTGSVHIFSCSRIGRPILEMYKSLTDIWVYRNWETEHYNSILEKTVLFLGIHKWKLGIYIGFSPALHLQCNSSPNPTLVHHRNWLTT